MRRRTFLRGIAATPLLSPTALLVADPTFDLIAHHRAAYAAFDIALRRNDGDGVEAENQAEQDAMDALLTPEPTTLGGLRALAEYMAQHDKRTGDFETAQWALATLAQASRTLIPAA